MATTTNKTQANDVRTILSMPCLAAPRQAKPSRAAPRLSSPTWPTRRDDDRQRFCLWRARRRRAQRRCCGQARRRRRSTTSCLRLHPDEPENGVGIALARSAHRAEPIHHGGLQPDELFAALVGLGFVGHAAERERPGNRLAVVAAYDRTTMIERRRAAGRRRTVSEQLSEAGAARRTGADAPLHPRAGL